jgi:hypothetical protein
MASGYKLQIHIGAFESVVFSSFLSATLAFLRIDHLFVLLSLSVFIGTKTQAQNLGHYCAVVTDVVGEIRNTDCILPV